MDDSPRVELLLARPRGLPANALYSLLGFAVPSVLMFAFTPLLVSQMGVNQYGLWVVSLSMIGFMSAFELGLGTALAKFVSERAAVRDVKGLSGIATAGLIAYSGIGLLLPIPLFVSAPALARLFANPSLPPSQVEPVMRLVALGLLPLMLKSAGVSIAAGLERFDIAMLAALGQNALTVIAAVVVVAIGGSVEMVVLSSLCVLVVIAGASLVLAIALLRALGVRAIFARQHAKMIIPYTIITSAASVGSIVFTSLDRITVGAILGLSAATYYTVSIGVASKLLALADVLSRPLMPASSARFAAGRVPEVRRYLRLTTFVIAALSTALGVTLLILSQPLLEWWMGPVFTANALIPFRILVSVYALMAVAAPAHHVANGIGYPQFSAVVAVIGGVGTIALIVVLGPTLGVAGAAWANAAYLLSLAIPVALVYVLRPRAAPSALGGERPTATER